MEGRFPGAGDVTRFWASLCAGVESITRFAAADGLVGAEGLLDDIDAFDAEFFGITPREAEITDPQHRLALETVWAAFDGAGYDPAAVPGSVGVYLSASMSSYLVRNLLPHPDLVDRAGGFGLLVHNDKDAVATSVSYRLGLRGPSLAVGSACSSSLVAVHLAVQSLLTFETDLAVAGGVGLLVPQRQGYRHSDAGIYSPDGRCRAFDAGAAGTVGGSGVGIVLLKRLSDARRDRDHVHAVLLGSAVTNDGGASQSFTAPGVDGQAAAISEAHSVAGISADEVGYVEGHGTGTPLGDAVEITALTQAFRRGTDRSGFCGLGSVKSNIGHLDAAAGVASLIKTVLVVREGMVPASLHVELPTTRVDLASSPFVVAAAPHRWTGEAPRTAGVSAFGIGGTNVHVVVREPPPPPVDPRPVRRWQPVPVSGRNAAALADAASAVAGHLRSTPPVVLADVALTMSGRRAQRWRRAVVATEPEGAARALLEQLEPAAVRPAQDRPIVMLLPGQGALRRGVAAALARDEPTFAAHLARCAGVLADLGVDLTAVLAGDDRGGPSTAQPAEFAVGYSLAATLEEWGVRASAFVGHSLGEYVAATLAGVFTVEAALRLVHVRGLLCSELPTGAMLVVAAGRAEVADAVADGGVSCAADNGPTQCVLSGPVGAIEAVEASLTGRGLLTSRLSVNVAHHGPAVDPIADRLRDAVRAASPAAATRRFASTVTGTWMDPATAADPDHWARHLRRTVRFGDALATVLSDAPSLVVDAGPSATLGALARRHPAWSGDHALICAQPPTADGADPAAVLVAAVADAWVAGVQVDWSRFHSVQGASRTPCPATPLRRRSHWIAPPLVGPAADTRDPAVPRPSPSGTTEFLRARCGELARTDPVPTIDSQPGLRGELEGLCAALARRWLIGAGVGLGPGSQLQVPELAARLHVLPEFHGLLDHLLAVLVADGQLVAVGGGLTATGHDPGDAGLLAAHLVTRHPSFAGLVELLVRCVDGYGTALSEPGAALGLLYPDGRGDLLARTIGSTGEHRHTSHGATAVAALVRHRAEGLVGPLRVLEVGAGGGGLTWKVVDALAGQRADVLVTDVNRLFCAHLAAEGTRRGTPVRTAAFDITRPADGQGVDGPFDLVLGLDVVHAVADVPAAVRLLRGLLAPGGELVLVETVAADPWSSMIWGLSVDWWGATDGLRHGGPLLDLRGWERAAVAGGLEAVDVVPLGAGPTSGPDTVIVVGRSPRSTRAAELPPRRPDPADWVHLPTWTRTAAHDHVDEVGERCLVFSDGPVGDAVLRAWERRGGEAIAVRPGRAPAPCTDGFVIDPADPGDYQALLAALVDEGRPPHLVVHAWSADGPRAATTLADIDDRLGRGMHSVLALARGHGATEGSRLRRVLAVTEGGQNVTGSDLIHPEHAGVAAAVKIVPREFPELVCSVLDVPADHPDAPNRMADLVVDELMAVAPVPVTALRGTTRWEPAFVPDRRRSRRTGARPGGVHLITGGLGGMGLALGEHLAGLPSTVVLTARTAFADAADWVRVAADPEEPDSATARRLLTARAAGGEIVTAAADVTDRDAMAALVRAVEARFGPITGVVHAAGVVDAAGMIARRSRADTDAAIAAKVHGTLVLDEVLGDRELDFFVLCSSLGPILHRLKFGEVGYVAGNEFLDAYAAFRTGRGHRGTLSIAWTDWVEAGMWARARPGLARFDVTDAEGALPVRPSDDLLQGITEAEGVELFRQLVGRDDTERAVISTQDLDALLAHHDAFSTEVHRDFVDRLRRAAPDIERPAGAGPYLAPTGPDEIAVAEMWESLIGVRPIGALDDFFELGGDSLLALRFLSRIRDELGAELTIGRLFEASTVRLVAADVEKVRRPAAAGDEEVLI